MEIPKETHTEIHALCAEGDVLLEIGDFLSAYKSYITALELVPSPKEAFEDTIWIMVALGDTYFRAKDYRQAARVLSDAMHCRGAVGNPFLHLRLGQAQFELGNHERASDELCRAYMKAGSKIFANDDEKYFKFLKTKISAPASGIW